MPAGGRAAPSPRLSTDARKNLPDAALNRFAASSTSSTPNAPSTPDAPSAPDAPGKPGKPNAPGTRRRPETGVRSGKPERHECPPAEHESATSGCAVFRRNDRSLLRAWGRAPRQMLHGMITNSIPEPPRPLDDAAPTGPLAEGPSRRIPEPPQPLEDAAARAPRRPDWQGRRTYGAVLTRKGRMVSDLRTFWLGETEEAGIALDAATAGLTGLLAHFAKYLPPRLAKIEDLADAVGLLTVAGDQSGPVTTKVFGAAPQDGCLGLDGGLAEGGAVVARGLEQPASWDVWAPRGQLEDLAAELCAAGAVPAGRATWETLRLEAGYPAYGAELDESVIPIEAGLERRAFDHDKGCYTGQEVVVRLLHRGRVNWRLRGLRLGEAEAWPGDPLFRTPSEKACGRITSCARSPKFGEWIGMGYVRREVEPPGVVALGSPAGPPVSVVELPPETR